MKWFLCPNNNLFLRPRFLLAYRPLCFSRGRHIAAWNSSTVRSTFIDYFKHQGHVIMPASSVIPKKGEGTYFTNAGMNQFKPLFLEELHPGSKYQNLVRAVNSQKCIRVGGKHNDLEDVGHDLTHHTFFEMLGNWSFGDYFKEDACRMAYKLLTENYGIAPDRLYFTYFAGDVTMNLPSDEECKSVWLSLGIHESRVLPFGVKDNFWDMGLTGPCGPCTEIHFDHVGNRDARSEVNAGSPSVVEIWNLVFMQYNRQKDQSLKQLRHFHVDTGMGLERMTAVLNGTADNYRTDLFTPIFEVIQKHASSCPYQGNKESMDTSYRVLADHARMFTVAISDGLLPSQENLGHKLRTILHRCIHLSRKVFHVNPEVLLPALVSVVVQSLGNAYPELFENEQRVCDIVRAAIEHHDKQQEQAIKTFNKMVARLGDSKELSAEVIAGLERGTNSNPVPLELISELALANGLTMDMAGYEMFLQERKINTSSDPLVSSPLVLPPDVASSLVSDLISRQVPQTNDAFKYQYTSVNDRNYDFSIMYQATSPIKVQGLSSNGEIIFKLEEGDQGQVILDKTCFYAESGGQEGDTGKLASETGEFHVTDVQYHRSYVVHHGHMTSGCLQIGQIVSPTISQMSREKCMHNHTATHLLNSALTEVAPSCQQQGSAVTPYKLTFDFHSLTLVDKNHVKEVEDDVRDAIKKEFQVSRKIMPLDIAMKLCNVKTLQNKEYPSEVSVVTVASADEALIISRELCAGTHVINTAHIGEFCITNMTTKSLNIKRMTCVTGQEAVQAHCQGGILQSISHLLQNLVEPKETPNRDLEKLMSLLQKTVALIDSKGEKLQHSQVYSCENKSRLNDLVEENEKAKDLCQAIAATISQLMGGSAEQEDIMKHLATHIRKGRLLELVPKTAKDDAHICLENCDYKVAEAVNRRGITLLQKMLEMQMRDTMDTSPVLLQIDHLDIGPRQIVKALSQQAWNKMVVLIQKSSKTIHILFSLPLSSLKHFTKDELDKILQQLSCFGSIKGKLASEKGNVAVYTISIQTDVASADVEYKLRAEKLLDK